VFSRLYQPNRLTGKRANRLNGQNGEITMKSQISIEEKALKRSMIGAFILAIWGVAMAWVSDSNAIMLDGMFNLISGIVSFFSIQRSIGIYEKRPQ